MKVMGISFFFMILCSSSLVYGLSLSEIELNPLGTDSGNEWIELASQNEETLTDYRIILEKEGRTKEYPLEGTCKRYCIIQFEGNWLTNSDTRISLVRQGTVIDNTPLLEDSANDEQTWSVCEDAWTYGTEPTFEEENRCDKKLTKLVDEESTAKVSEKERSNFVTPEGLLFTSLPVLFGFLCLLVALGVIFKVL